ncbi:hypothetical protein EFK38_02015 [Lactococcus lactis subsp. lactis]|nr:hypothetical protein [Lactococcus lactis subsp. lactis]
MIPISIKLRSALLLTPVSGNVFIFSSSEAFVILLSKTIESFEIFNVFLFIEGVGSRFGVGSGFGIGLGFGIGSGSGVGSGSGSGLGASLI